MVLVMLSLRPRSALVQTDVRFDPPKISKDVYGLRCDAKTNRIEDQQYFAGYGWWPPRL